MKGHSTQLHYISLLKAAALDSPTTLFYIFLSSCTSLANLAL
jgi:hypothetical protein